MELLRSCSRDLYGNTRAYSYLHVAVNHKGLLLPSCSGGIIDTFTSRSF